MQYLADVLLVAGALGAGIFCFVLSRRLATFNDLEKGVGGAVAALSTQVDELNRTMLTAKRATDGSGEALEQLTERAEDVSRQLELMMASMHDLHVPNAGQGASKASPLSEGEAMFQSARSFAREAAE